MPDAPTNLAATLATGTEIDLSWTDASSNETGFKVARCDGAACSPSTVVHTPAANATTQADTGLTVLTSYTYKVAATNLCGDSAYTSTVTQITYYAEDCTGASICFKFNEPSGATVDSVAALSLPEIGSPTHSIVSAGDFTALSTGDRYDTAGNYHGTTSLVAALSPNTSSWTDEMFVSCTKGDGLTAWLYDEKDVVNSRGISAAIARVDPTSWLIFSIRAEDDTAVNITDTSNGAVNWCDGTIRKIRWGVNTAGDSTIHVNGVLMNTTDASSLSGKTIKANGHIFGGNMAQSQVGEMTFYFWRRTIGSYTANMGGPGGG